MLTAKGLAKLVEECGELTQIAGKKMAYMHTDDHPDGKGSMKSRLEDEIADVTAICAFVMGKLKLDRSKIKTRCRAKFKTFDKWDDAPNNQGELDG